VVQRFAFLFLTSITVWQQTEFDEFLMKKWLDERLEE